MIIWIVTLIAELSYEEIGHLENDASACKGRMLAYLLASLAKCMAMTLGSKEHCLGERMLGILRMFGESFAFATGNDGRDGHIAGIRRPDAS